ncbi:hypothetical protein niasHT_018253 [Heterodera trifolii]|uniref:Uncharacterized protein n=1 Tax=Heterodera trifolii TaxID=157864 RepID=A0ABD2L5A8_9BILA
MAFSICTKLFRHTMATFTSLICLLITSALLPSASADSSLENLVKSMPNCGPLPGALRADAAESAAAVGGIGVLGCAVGLAAVVALVAAAVWTQRVIYRRLPGHEWTPDASAPLDEPELKAAKPPQASVV